MRSLAPALLVVMFCPLTVAIRAQSISQDYASYSSTLNQERADEARRDQQALYDQSARNARNSSSGGSRGSSSSGRSRGSSASGAGIGTLGDTLSSVVKRHDAAAAARHANSNDPRYATSYEDMLKRPSAQADRMQAEKKKKRRVG